MTNAEQILIIANQLANQGKKPTVALIKAKLIGPVSLPVIISTLKSWQHDPLYIMSADIAAPASAPLLPTRLDSDTLAQISVALEQALSPLRQQLTDIQQQLNELKSTKSTKSTK